MGETCNRNVTCLYIVVFFRSAFVGIYVYVYVYIYVCVCIYIYVCVCVCVCGDEYFVDIVQLIY